MALSRNRVWSVSWRHTITYQNLLFFWKYKISKLPPFFVFILSLFFLIFFPLCSPYHGLNLDPLFKFACSQFLAFRMKFSVVQCFGFAYTPTNLTLSLPRLSIFENRAFFYFALGFFFLLFWNFIWAPKRLLSFFLFRTSLHIFFLFFSFFFF